MFAYKHGYLSDLLWQKQSLRHLHLDRLPKPFPLKERSKENRAHRHQLGIRSGDKQREALREKVNALDYQKKFPNSTAYGLLLRECSSQKALPEGRRVHAHIIRAGLEQDTFLANLLLTMYSKCNDMEHAFSIFDSLQNKNVFSWTAIIGACLEHENDEEALRLFQKMLHQGLKPDQVTFVVALGACSTRDALSKGKLIHDLIVAGGFESNVIVGTALVNMYARCGNLEVARQLFDQMPERNVVSWNAMISSYAQNGQSKEAIQLFHKMQSTGLKPNKVTFVNVITACSDSGDLVNGRAMHKLLSEKGLESDLVIGTALVNLYGKYGALEDAKHIFEKLTPKDVILWNAMITAYVEGGHRTEAFQLFRLMQQQRMEPDKVTYLNILDACQTSADLSQGQKLHGQIAKRGCGADIVVKTALVGMYSRCGSLEDARKLFKELPERDTIACTAMIGVYVQHGHAKEALQLYGEMKREGVYLDKVATMSILDACASLSALEDGKRVHEYIVKREWTSVAVVKTALINMYSKCGSLKDARLVFDNMSERTTVSWSAIIGASSQHGQGEEVLYLFGQMQQEGFKFDEVTLLSVLSACSHSGLMDEGHQYFASVDHPSLTVDHYCCMIDLLGRAGRLDEADKLIRGISFQSDALLWMTLLGASRIHGDMERGKCAAERLLELDPQNASAHVVLSNIYAAAGKWKDVAKVRSLMEGKGIKKEPGHSLIEVNSTVHEFVVGDKSHPQTFEIYQELERLIWQIKSVGYVPDLNLVLHDVEGEQKEDMILYHSEKLAIAFGLISLPQEIPIRIVKNLRVCADCHTAIKFISRVVDREIFVRDARRFHHFWDGACSCGDYW
ncbi:hypothetical protein O6H91_21G067500 [Diphasiastrum complanatum]|uniref:Uncharacterized protein n=1 Tax=Diphasiastrum complanatum TaxID=34168 RepID=A0ACC2ALH5_DIPCM|nr:hypothetical protein O6H91_21G067500 [Diphasiastrum complanatum]